VGADTFIWGNVQNLTIGFGEGVLSENGGNAKDSESYRGGSSTQTQEKLAGCTTRHPQTPSPMLFAHHLSS